MAPTQPETAADPEKENRLLLGGLMQYFLRRQLTLDKRGRSLRWTARFRRFGGLCLQQTTGTTEVAWPTYEVWDTPEQALAAFKAYHEGRGMATLFMPTYDGPSLDRVCPYKVGSDGHRLWVRGFNDKKAGK